MKKYLLIALLFTLPLTAATYAWAGPVASQPKAMEVPHTEVITREFPAPLQSYQDEHMEGLWEVLKNRVEADWFNLVGTILFIGAILHTFMASQFHKIAEKVDLNYKRKLAEQGLPQSEGGVSFMAEMLYLMGEIEAVLGIWILPLMIMVCATHGWGAFVSYIDDKVNYNEPIFVVVIMAIASTRPILYATERVLQMVANVLGKGSPGAWWFSILCIAPILGSFITEPAAMTIAAILLAQRFYKLEPSNMFKYATLGLLCVNVSVGGTLTHFAAPPVLMVAGTWGWDVVFMFIHFGESAIAGILISTTLYGLFFRKELKLLKEKAKAIQMNSAIAVKKDRVPFWIIAIHILFLVWTVFNLHHTALYVGGFLFFLAFTQATAHYQYQIQIKGPLLVGFFLAGLVTHGGLQQWWIEPVLSRLSEIPLFLGATVLTAFNDNAAITFLASLVPAFEGNITLQKAVVAGAVTGGGLTVIANAPNLAGQSILAKHFREGVSPLYFFFGAIIPTVIVGSCFMFFH